MSAAHTPGPWFYEVNPDAMVGLSDAPVISIRTRAEGFECDSSICGIHVMDNLSGSDARLIAAAPELLEACQAINALDPQESSAGDWNEAFKLIAAAIAKATGGQQ